MQDDCGDHVVLINTSEIALPGDEWKKRAYFHHTGFPGGASWTLAWELHQKDPTLVGNKFNLSNSDLINLSLLTILDHEKSDLSCSRW